MTGVIDSWEDLQTELLAQIRELRAYLDGMERRLEQVEAGLRMIPSEVSHERKDASRVPAGQVDGRAKD